MSDRERRTSAEHAEAMRERTRDFALRVLRLSQALPKSRESDVLGSQLLRSATSTAANYRAACRARSRAAFVAKLDIVVEELDESAFWLDLLAAAHIVPAERLDALVAEADTLVRILATARQTARRNDRA